MKSLWALFIVSAFAVQLVISSKPGHTQTVDVPTEARLGELEKSISKTYELTAAKSKAEKHAILVKLVNAVDNERKQKQLNEQSYAALTVALQLSQETCHVAQFQNLLKIMDTHFAITDEKFTVKQVNKYLNLCKKWYDFELSWPGLVAIAFEHAASKRFDTAIAILDETLAVAAKNKWESARKKLAGMKARVEERKESQHMYEAARDRLKKEPDNPKANFAVGYWLAVYESKWTAAEGHLVKSDQKKWQTAAQSSINVNTPVELLSEADGWWNLWTSFSDKAADLDAAAAVGSHLHELYTPLQAQVAQGVTKDLVEIRLAKIKSAIDAEAASRKPENALEKSAFIALKAEAELLPSGQWVDALKLVQLPEDGLLGTWQLKNNVLSCEASRDATCRIPVVVRGNYEFECSFVRQKGTDTIVFAIPLENGFCAVVLSGWEGKASGLLALDGKPTLDLDPKKSGAAVKPGTLINGAVHQLRVSVRQANGNAKISATINGLSFISWQGAVSRLSPWPFFNFNRPEVLGVAAHQGIVDFRSFQLRVIPERTLKGNEPYSCAYRLSNDWLTPITAINDAPPTGLKCIVLNGKSYYLSDKPMCLTSAQCLAKQLGGRLLTVSSNAENEFILNEGKGLIIWTAAHRRSKVLNWFDERNRPLRFTGKFGPWQPNNGDRENQIGLITGNVPDRGWHDVDFAEKLYACIEWDEEYPE